MVFLRKFVLSISLLGCSLAPRAPAVRSAADADVSMDAPRSFALVRAERVPEPYRRLDFSDEVQGKLVKVAREVLGDAGWVEAPEDVAEVLLYLAVGKRFAEVGGGPEEARPFGPLTAASDDTVTLDAFDAETRDHLWHGRVPFRAQSDEAIASEREFRALLAALPEPWFDAEPEPSDVELADGEKRHRENPGESTSSEPSSELAPVGEFDDEVDEFDEFDDLEASDASSDAESAPAVGSDNPVPPESGGGEFDDEFGGEFDDEF